jgi:hypothetical protein
MGKVKGKEVLRYEELSLILKAEGKERELEKDVTAHFIDDYTIGIRLYHTDVITIYPNNLYEMRISVASGKTLDMLCAYTPACVVLGKDLKFYVCRDASKGARRANLVPFYNGLTVDKLGNLFSVQA